MNCKKCGAILAENDQFCKNCGETANSQMNSVEGQIPINSNSNGINQSMNNSNIQSSPNSYSQQPINNNQQPWANYNNAPMYNNQPVNKPSGNGKYIAIGLAVVVGIFAIIFIVGMIVNKDDNSSLTSGGSSNVTQTSSKSNYKVSFKGFTFEIPDNMVYEEDNGVLLIGDEEGTWATQLELEQGSFAQLKANKGQLQALMTQNGYTSSIASEKTLGGVEFITMEISASGQKAIAALAKANSMYFIGVTAMNQDNEFDYKLLETIAPVISSAQYTGSTTNNMNGFTNFNMDGISDLAK